MTQGDKMKQMLSGNEAIARGAYEAGVAVATGYPGTPSTEIMESLVQFKDIAIEWCPNEKVALDGSLYSSFLASFFMTTLLCDICHSCRLTHLHNPLESLPGGDAGT